ncbi:hypothetical protein [Spelaeicoccus albus]|nr:hypothetical protein [Spelaeicoccus albus]
MNELTVRPVRFTAHPDVFHGLLEALGAVTLARHGSTALYRTGSGLLEIRGTDEVDPLTGLTAMGFVTANLAQLPAPSRFLDKARLTADVGPAKGAALELTAGDGLTIAIDLAPSGDRDPARSGDADPELSVVPIWMTTQVSAAAEALQTLGFARRLSADSGVWVDLVGRGAANGLVAVHYEDGDPDVILAFEYAGDLGELQSRMRSHGIVTPIVDENYARTLRLLDPDNEAEIWVNEVMTDTYGYQRG